MSALLQIRDLVVTRGGRTVLQVDELDVQKGEVLAVVGPNGAGKSTLLLALARLIRAQRGRILFNGQPAGAESDTAYRRRLALVLQDALLFDLSVFDNVALGLRFRGVAPKEIAPRVNAWLERLGVAGLKDRRATRISGGEAQRVSLARALVLGPELLLLDEPFAALDPPTRARLLDDLRVILPETGTTTVFITHNLDEARRLAGRMAIFLDGKVRQVGAPDQILAAPADEGVSSFFSQGRSRPNQPKSPLARK
jgi:tungstate transport system ATP-binding protein